MEQSCSAAQSRSANQILVVLLILTIYFHTGNKKKAPWIIQRWKRETRLSQKRRKSRLDVVGRLDIRILPSRITGTLGEDEPKRCKGKELIFIRTTNSSRELLAVLDVGGSTWINSMRNSMMTKGTLQSLIRLSPFNPPHPSFSVLHPLSPSLAEH